MRCEQCGTENANEAKFCCRCGNPMARQINNQVDRQVGRKGNPRGNSGAPAGTQLVKAPKKGLQKSNRRDYRTNQDFIDARPEYRKKPSWMFPVIGSAALLLVVALIIGSVVFVRSRNGKEIHGGATLTKAKSIKYNTKYTGTYNNKAEWYTFKTGKDEDVSYRIVLENQTVESNDLTGYLCEKDGTKITPSQKNNNRGEETMLVASQDGVANSCMFDTLEPNTDYYIEISGDGRTNYSLRVTDPSGKPYDDNAGRKVLSQKDAYADAPNMDDAPLLKLNTQYDGKYKGGYGWVAFTTGDDEGVPYSITVENQTAGSGAITGYLFNEYGEKIKPTEKNSDGYYEETIFAANEDGAPSSCMFDNLEPDTTYYIQLTADNRAKYLIEVKDSDK